MFQYYTNCQKTSNIAKTRGCRDIENNKLVLANLACYGKVSYNTSIVKHPVDNTAFPPDFVSSR